jgi:hypothetical protein
MSRSEAAIEMATVSATARYLFRSLGAGSDGGHGIDE